MSKQLTAEKVEEFYREYHTPERVIRHCKEVSRVAVAIGKCLNEHGYNFDIQALEMAGLVHDVMRTQENHGEAAADMLEKQGYTKVADMVREHMHYDFNPIEKLNETDILCLADRVVKEDHYVGIDDRVDYLINKHKDDPDLVRLFRHKKGETIKFIAEIENKMGQTLDSLFQ